MQQIAPVSVFTIPWSGYTLTTDKELMRPAEIYRWIRDESYWAEGLPEDIFLASFRHSYCIGALREGHQVAFARLVTDYATFGYLADVYVTEPHRGRGLSKKMMELVLDQEWVKRLRRIMLATRDAQELYRKYGFENCARPERMMEIVRPDIYRDSLQPTKKVKQ